VLRAGPYCTASGETFAVTRKKTDSELLGAVAWNDAPTKFVLLVAAQSYSITPSRSATFRTSATPRLMYTLGRPRYVSNRMLSLAFHASGVSGTAMACAAVRRAAAASSNALATMVGIGGPDNDIGSGVEGDVRARSTRTSPERCQPTTPTR
jgi:hypothetical protein